MRPINFRSQRFNQQLAPGAIIVEVGTNGNTFEEALYGAECFAEALAEYICANN
jgi:stage II sporulation protein P